MKKTFALILALIMSMSVFASCAKPDAVGSESPDESTPAVQESTPQESEEETLSEYEEAGLPEGLDFGNETVNVIYWERWDSTPNEFYVDSKDLTGNPVDDAIYKRNLYTEQLLGVDLEFVHLYLETGNINEMLDWCNRLENMMNDPATPVDIFA